MNNKLDKVIKESINRFLLREYYKADLYHFTSLEHALNIVKYDGLIRAHEDREFNFKKKRNDIVSVSLSRTQNPKLGYQGHELTMPLAMFTIDTEKLMGGKIRGGKLVPHEFYDSARNKFRHEFEERFFGDIPLEYVKGLTIINDGESISSKLMKEFEAACKTNNLFFDYKEV